MIKLNRPPEPSKLTVNKAAWTNDLMAAVSKYGSYKAIPDGEKAKLVSHYKDDAIKTPLTASSNEKCAYCECFPTESGYFHIDHFKPKSMYPQDAFTWDNLIPSCEPCNKSKSDHDTGVNPIVDPYTTNPAALFYYENLRIKASPGGGQTVAQTTIDVCDLNSRRLCSLRADILVELSRYFDELDEIITHFTPSSPDSAKQIHRLRKSIASVETLITPKEKVSGFCNYILTNDTSYQKAKALLTAYPSKGAV